LSRDAVSLRAAEKTFGPRRALAPVDLAVAKGSFVSLLGPSGCGKSTLLRMIAGLIDPSAGAITRDEGSIGFVFQAPTLMPWAKVIDNVALPLKLADVSDAASRARDALAGVDLADFTEVYPHQLSGGMRMRAAIARAIVMQPSLLLMDEPFAALDEITRFKLNDQLLELWRKHRWTVIFVTHSIREAVFLSERVVVMSPRPGRIVADITVALPQERTPALRLSHVFADQCAQVNGALTQAMEAA
jgi:NitT/TauT family transport system ATP-binding protein